MSWKLKRKAQSLLAGEEGQVHKDWGGRMSISLESLRPLKDFDLIGFSVTYEGDYINAVRLLDMAGIPLRASERGDGDPIVLMGGVCAFSNPEPLAPFMDAIAVGEGEELVGEIVDAWRASGAEAGLGRRRVFLERLASLAGIYVPGAYDVGYAADGTIEAVRPRETGAPGVIVKRRLGVVDDFETRSMLKTP